MEAQGTLPCSEEPIAQLCPEPDDSSPHGHTHSLNTHSNIIFPSTPKKSRDSSVEIALGYGLHTIEF
jgi:hypothetical protein